MEGVEHRIARDLFDVAKNIGKRLLFGEKGGIVGDADGSGVFEFSVTFLELLGRYATDLVGSSTEIDTQGNPVRKEVTIREDNVKFIH
jgi:kinesin family member 2/24